MTGRGRSHSGTHRVRSRRTPRDGLVRRHASLTHRDPGLVGAAPTREGILLGLIADPGHLSAEAIRLAFAAAPAAPYWSPTHWPPGRELPARKSTSRCTTTSHAAPTGHRSAAPRPSSARYTTPRRRNPAAHRRQRRPPRPRRPLPPTRRSACCDQGSAPTCSSSTTPSPCARPAGRHAPGAMTTSHPRAAPRAARGGKGMTLSPRRAARPARRHRCRTGCPQHTALPGHLVKGRESLRRGLCSLRSGGLATLPWARASRAARNSPPHPGALRSPY